MAPPNVENAIAGLVSLGLNEPVSLEAIITQHPMNDTIYQIAVHGILWHRRSHNAINDCNTLPDFAKVRILSFGSR